MDSSSICGVAAPHRDEDAPPQFKSMSDVNAKLDEAALYIKRNRTLVKSITSFPYIAKSY
jgi:hypothetical protein